MAYLGITIPRGKVSFSQLVTLDGREYLLGLEWNQRSEKWYLTLADQDGDPICGRVKVVADFPLLRLVNEDRRPPGLLICRDNSGQGLDPHKGDFDSDRCTLVYIPLADLADL